MKIKVLILTFFAGSFFVSSCQKDINIFVPDPGQINSPDTSWQNIVSSSMPISVLMNDLLPGLYKDTISVNTSSDTITTPFNLQVIFPQNCCATGSGLPVASKIDVELIVAKNKGDMIRLNKPTSYNDSIMITAVQIFIQLKKNGQLLQLAPGVRISIRYYDAPVNPQMKFFIGDESNAQYFNWLPTPNPSADTIIMGTQFYEILTNNQRWMSVANLYDMNVATPQVQLSADIAPYFTNANTSAFAVFKDLSSVIAMKADLGTRKFITGNLPVGKQVTVVVISKLGNDYYLGYESATTQSQPSNTIAQPVHVVPIKKSLSEILVYLSTL